MKWFLFLFIAIVSCQQDKNPEFETVTYDPSILSKKDGITAQLPSGSSKKETLTPLEIFFSKNISQSSLKLFGITPELTSDSLSGKSIVRNTNSGTTIIADSLRIGKLLIVQLYNGEDGTLKSFKIDGKKFDRQMGGEPLSFNKDELMFFIFKGKNYYYLQANLLYTYGGSIRNIYYHMIYDEQNRELTMFNSCRFYRPICFGDVDGDDQLDFMHFQNDDFCTTIPSSANFEVNLYSCNKKGKFELQKDKSGKTYFISGNSGESYLQDSFNISKSYWPVEIK